MNINFGMDNFYVRYLKRFLNSEFQQTNTVLGAFDKEDQKLLIQYLNLPNVATMGEATKGIEQKFPRLNDLFTMRMKDGSAIWTAKEISLEASEYIMTIIDSLEEYCKSIGWYVKSTYEWVDLTKDINNDNVVDTLDKEILENIIYHGTEYPEDIKRKADINLDGIVDLKDLQLMESYITGEKPYIEVAMSNRKNYFPNKDMLVFVNQFDGTFLYNYAIRDGVGVDDIPHKNSSGDYKVALYECKPNQKITIAHNNSRSTRLVIGSSSARLKQDVTNFMLENVQEVTLNRGDHFEYQTSGSETGTYDARWVVIQCPSHYGNLSGDTQNTITIELGDINFDGKIDMEDYKLISYYTATGPGSEELHWEATPRQLAAMDIYKDGIIDNRCAVAVWDYIHGTWPGPSLGLHDYTYSVPSDYKDVDNVSNLLIIDGWYDEEVGIPYLDFAEDSWIIHEKFFNYLLNMAVTKYSNSENITFVQSLLKEWYRGSIYNKKLFYPGYYSDEMRNILSEYQHSKVEYTYGDLSRNGKLDEDDLTIMREYLYGVNELMSNCPITLQELRDYLDGVIQLTGDKLEWADVNRDGVIDEKDYVMLKLYRGDEELLTKILSYINGQGTLDSIEESCADVNKDGKVDIDDYNILSNYPRALNGLQQTYADVNHDNTIDITDYAILKSNVDGVSESLKVYHVKFALGWYDVQTEFLLEQDVNLAETISEVSK